MIKRAVNELSLTIRTGEIFGLLGPNGAVLPLHMHLPMSVLLFCFFLACVCPPPVPTSSFASCFSFVLLNVLQGKTTTISMLTGVESSSEGSASICGFDIRTQIGHVHKHIGVCPQHDKVKRQSRSRSKFPMSSDIDGGLFCASQVWGDLSVRQHLIFYALMRGMPRSRTALEARRLAEKVELDGDVYNKAASSLSGGMKRRL